MRMPYEIFRSKYLSKARLLASDCSDLSLAEKLCNLAYKSLSDKDLYNRREVFTSLAEIYFSQFAPQYASSCDGLIKALYPKNKKCPEILDRVTLDEFLDTIYPVLREEPLFCRIMGGLRVLGWNNEQITKLFNEAIKPFESKVGNVLSLVKIVEFLGCFRKNVCEIVTKLDDKRDWLCSLFNHINGPLCEIETLQTLINVSEMPPNIRFARQSNPERDKYGWLREQWWPLARKIRSVIEKTDSEQRKQDLA